MSASRVMLPNGVGYSYEHESTRGSYTRTVTLTETAEGMMLHSDGSAGHDARSPRMLLPWQDLARIAADAATAMGTRQSIDVYATGQDPTGPGGFRAVPNWTFMGGSVRPGALAINCFGEYDRSDEGRSGTLHLPVGIAAAVCADLTIMADRGRTTVSLADTLGRPRR